LQSLLFCKILFSFLPVRAVHVLFVFLSICWIFFCVFRLEYFYRQAKMDMHMQMLRWTVEKYTQMDLTSKAPIKVCARRFVSLHIRRRRLATDAAAGLESRQLDAALQCHVETGESRARRRDCREWASAPEQTALMWVLAGGALSWQRCAAQLGRYG
jgi:hypothetical protein